ncbi:transcriptional regulator domain-containing protein [Allosphingosinicella vermicomposti]|uniref:transcriptional regulator domain-containing protein n=1 Tax=Allosphingosinicella vermicomposti TaxID=614671 RepID=UPI00131A4A2F|nr:DUF6499 domain-containing protein [Allosphingosinicella vermicomposti]
MASPAPAETQWREQSAYQPLRGLDRAGFAWEFLRRNEEYRRTARLHCSNAPSKFKHVDVRQPDKEEARAAAPWCLHFLGGPRP